LAVLAHNLSDSAILRLSRGSDGKTSGKVANAKQLPYRPCLGINAGTLSATVLAEFSFIANLPHFSHFPIFPTLAPIYIGAGKNGNAGKTFFPPLIFPPPKKAGNLGNILITYLYLQL
jgi:hypothetical protein